MIVYSKHKYLFVCNVEEIHFENWHRYTFAKRVCFTEQRTTQNQTKNSFVSISMRRRRRNAQYRIVLDRKTLSDMWHTLSERIAQHNTQEKKKRKKRNENVRSNKKLEWQWERVTIKENRSTMNGCMGCWLETHYYSRSCVFSTMCVRRMLQYKHKNSEISDVLWV